jgi:hypothetical protein
LRGETGLFHLNNEWLIRATVNRIIGKHVYLGDALSNRNTIKRAGEGLFVYVWMVQNASAKDLSVRGF